jgi:pimeloyl-ACP methyl ester carboxylesterase
MSTNRRAALGSLRTSIAFLVCVALGACTGVRLKQYRSATSPCDAIQQPVDSQVERLSQLPQRCFVEIDDQGVLWSEEQFNNAIAKVREVTIKDAGKSLVVVFVHGWNNNAGENSNDISRFEDILLRLARLEQAEATNDKVPPRKIVGVYVGWRGNTVPLASIWARREVARRIGEGALARLLAEMEKLRYHSEVDPTSNRIQLVLLGHSLGANSLFTAISARLVERLVIPARTAMLADMVLMWNPAMEASRFRQVSELGREVKSANPLLCVIAAYDDGATALWPIVQALSGPLEWLRLRDWHEFSSFFRAVGHEDKLVTHRLEPSNETASDYFEARADFNRRFQVAGREPRYERSQSFEESLVDLYLKRAATWQPGDRTIALGSTRLTPLKLDDLCRPVMVASTFGVIKNHGGKEMLDQFVVEYLAAVSRNLLNGNGTCGSAE